MDPAPELQAKPQDTSRSRRRQLLLLVPLVLGAIAGAAGLGILPASNRDVGPAVISASARVGPAQTVVRVPLLGSVSASTHSAPLELRLGVDEVDPNAVEEAFKSDESRARLGAELQHGLETGVKQLALRAILAAGLIGALAAVILPHRRLWWLALGGAGGALSVAGLFALTSAQFDVQAFQQPRYRGAVERAPQIIEAVQRRAGSIEGLKSRFSTGADRLSRILALAGQPLDNPHVGTVAILHISDIHSNPLGLELAKQLAGNFKVDAILDTGDVTSFGEPIEGRIAELIPGMPAPYLLVPGNHDSDANRTTLAQTPNVTLLHNTVADVKGVKIMGWADPAFTAKQGLSQEEADRLQQRDAPGVAARVKEVSPDVLAVHNPLLADDSTGKVPLVLAGHRHRQSSRQQGGTLVLEVGSTGATGLGSFVVEADHAYQAQIVYFRDSRPAAVDYIRLSALGAEFEVERRSLAPAPDE